MIVAMTFIPKLGEARRSDPRRVRRGRAAGARADADRPPDRAPLRDRRPARGPPGQHVPDPAWRRHRGRDGVPPGGPWRSWPSTARDDPACSARCRRASSRPCCSEVRWRRPSARLDDLLDLRARWQLAGQLGLGLFAVAARASTSGSSRTRSAGAVIRFEGPFAVGVHDLLDRRDDQQHQLHRRARRPVVRHRVHRRGHAGDHQPDERGQPAAHRGPVLHPRRRAARVPALEPPSRRRSSRARAASSSSATRWRCSRSSARRRSRSPCSSSGVPIIDTFWIIVRRVVAAPFPVQPRPRPHPPSDARPGPLAPADGLRHLRDLPRARGAGAGPVRRRPSSTRSSACSWRSGWCCSSRRAGPSDARKSSKPSRTRTMRPAPPMARPARSVAQADPGPSYWCRLPTVLSVVCGGVRSVPVGGCRGGC